MATLPADDPSCNAQKPSFASIDDDVEDGDTCKEGMDDIMIMSSINAVDVHRLSWSPALDLQAKTVADHPDDDPYAIRAQVDAQAHMSCTDQQHMLHGH